MIKFIMAFAPTLFTSMLALSAPPNFDVQTPDAERVLRHTLSKPGVPVVIVIFADYPSGPKCSVTEFGTDMSRKERSFAISKAQFNKLWKGFFSSGAEKYVWTRKGEKFELGENYSFIAAKQHYVVPKKKAPQGVVSIALQLEAYTK